MALPARPITPGQFINQWIEFLQPGSVAPRPGASLTGQAVLAYINSETQAPTTTPEEGLMAIFATLRNLCTAGGIISSLSVEDLNCIPVDPNMNDWLKSAVQENVEFFNADLALFIESLPDIANTLVTRCRNLRASRECKAHLQELLESIVQGLYAKRGDVSNITLTEQGSFAVSQPALPPISHDSFDWSSSMDMSVQHPSAAGLSGSLVFDPSEGSAVGDLTEDTSTSPSLNPSPSRQIDFSARSVAAPRFERSEDGVVPMDPTDIVGPDGSQQASGGSQRWEDSRSGIVSMELTNIVGAGGLQPASRVSQRCEDSRSGIVSMELTNIVGAGGLQPASHVSQRCEDSRSGLISMELTDIAGEHSQLPEGGLYVPIEDRRVSESLSATPTPMAQPRTGVPPSAPTSSASAAHDGVKVGDGDESAAASVHSESDAERSSNSERSKAPSFDPERSARAQSSPPYNRLSRSKARPAHLPKSSDADRLAGERKVSGQSTRSSRSDHFTIDFNPPTIAAKEREIASLTSQLQALKDQLAQEKNERERERQERNALISMLQSQLASEKKEHKEEREREKQELKEVYSKERERERQDHADVLAKLEAQLAKEQEQRNGLQAVLIKLVLQREGSPST